MNIERYVSLFDKQSDKLIQEVNISYVSLDTLKKIFGSHKDDPTFYMVYRINKKKLKALNRYLDNPIQGDTDNITYQLECFQA